MAHLQEKKEIYNSLVEKINNFDLYYEMSDSNIVFSNGQENKNKIKLELESLTVLNLKKNFIFNKLNSNGKLVWNRYFK